jgi:hypothetical protein
MSQSSEKPTLEFGADKGYFDEDTYQVAVNELSPYFRVGGGLFIELSQTQAAKVTLEFALATLYSIPPNLISSVIYDVLKSRFLRRRAGARTTFTFSFREDPYQRSVSAQIETSSSEDLEAALATLQDVVLDASEGQSFQFDNENQRWEPYRR